LTLRLGFYDSGLGGLSVLKAFIERFGNKFSYFYYGDSANAPYGEKTPQQLLELMKNIFNFMQDKDIDLVISACNTSSMYLDQIDKDDYPFEILSLFSAMKKFFTTYASTSPIAFLATQATIDSKRYLEWNVEIYPIACPAIVPLMEAGDLESAKLAFDEYLSQVPPEIKTIIIGCTHYSFLVENRHKIKYNFIDPAEIITSQFADSVYSISFVRSAPSDSLNLDLSFHFTKGDQVYFQTAQSLLAI
jgi:glutamate racemase